MILQWSKVLLNPNRIRQAIVLVDDEPDLLQLFSGVLKPAGFDVISFDNPLSAVDYMQEHHSEI